MDEEVKIEYFADAEQEALERWICDYVFKSSKITNEGIDDNFASKVAALSWIRQEGILRLSQSLINILQSADSLLEINRINWLYAKFFTKSTIDEQELMGKLMQLIDPFVHPQLEILKANSSKHRNVCIVLQMIIDKCSTALKPQINDQLVDYLMVLFERSISASETNLWALLVLEKLCATSKRLSESRLPTLCNKLQILADTLVQLGNRFYKMDFDFVGYQVAFCAKWLLDRLKASQYFDPLASPVKMLSNEFTVRSDNRLDPPIKSTFAVSSGIYFYEVVLLTSGTIRLGWATNECDFEHNETERLGDDEFSIAFDGFTKCIWHDRKRYSVKCKVHSWKAGDVIGALLDLENGKATFYLNGSEVQHKKKLTKKFAKLTESQISEETIAPITFYAAASIGAHQQCYFNFGQQPFAYPPSGVKFVNFHTAADCDARKYQILEPSLSGGSYWFKRQPINNTVEPLMRDGRQKDFNRWVKELESRISENDYDYEYFYGDLKWEFERLMKDELAYIRLIQAVIRKMGTIVEEEQLDVVVGWITYYFSTLDETHSTGRDLPEIWFFDRSDVDSNGSCPNLPAPARFLEMIYPYTQLAPQSEADVLKIRNTCVALSILARKYWYLSDLLDQEVVAFISKILSESQDHRSRLFALLCLDNLTLDQRVKRTVLDKVANLPNQAKYLEQLSMANIYEPSFDAARYQLAFCARWCLDYVLVEDSRLMPQPPADFLKDCLNRESSTEQLKLSPDQLSARSDDGWQSVKSEFAVSSGIYFYEVVLLTSGPMRIGWATRETDFCKTNVGDDKQSIGLDRFQRCIWHDADRFKIKSQPAWAPGDVIGCLIDVPNEKFTFFLNGAVIGLKKQFFKKFNFSSEPYYAAVTLWPHQHCFFNFGQAPFKYPPPGSTTFGDFFSTSISSSTNSSPNVGKHSILRRHLFDVFPSTGHRVSINPPTIK